MNCCDPGTARVEVCRRGLRRHESALPVCCARCAVLAHGDRRGTGPHPVGVERAAQMVDLVRDEAGQAAAECRDVVPATRVLVFDLDSQRARDHAPHVEEAEAAFILFVRY